MWLKVYYICLMNTRVSIVECPRDAMQGLHNLIPTDMKVNYIQSLLDVGFDVLDFGSFVSPKAVPQMADTAEVLSRLDLSKTKTELLAIVANVRGAEEAAKHAQIRYLGYPFSVSETFQQRNTGKSVAESMGMISDLQEICAKHDKTLVVYLSMAFGNPYGDPWTIELVIRWAEKMMAQQVKIISLADTIGNAYPGIIVPMMKSLIEDYPATTFGAHFHSTPDTRMEKLAAAWNAGCRRFDSAMMGFGGCPFAADDLTGNIATESLLEFLEMQGVDTGVNRDALLKAQLLAGGVFA